MLYYIAGFLLGVRLVYPDSKVLGTGAGYGYGYVCHVLVPRTGAGMGMRLTLSCIQPIGRHKEGCILEVAVRVRVRALCSRVIQSCLHETSMDSEPLIRY